MEIDYIYYLSKLQEFHGLFYKLWEMGKPLFSKEVETAAVKFNRNGEFFEFIFNENFWNSLNEYERLFIICHECLHVLYNHGIRTNSKIDDIVNTALDIVVNHSLFNFFGFSQEKIISNKLLANLCTTDTVFKEHNPKPSDNECFEYYYNLIKSSSNVNVINPIDIHNYLTGLSDDFFQKLGESLCNSEKIIIGPLCDKHFTLIEKENAENTLAGNMPGNSWLKVSTGNIKKKKKWETVIKQWSRKYLNGQKNLEQWARINRRFQFIQSDLFIPSEMEVDNFDDEKIEVWFFQDTSGSCHSFAKRFFTAAKSLPKDRFNIRMHCFDTKVYETTLESGKLYGFGGTSFSILENYIQNTISKENKKYPEAVFVITDGYGDHVNPQIPKKWYWFLSTSCRSYINKKCNFFNLKDFE